MKKLYLLFFTIATFLHSISQTPTVGFSSVITGLTAPVDIVNAKDGSNRLFILQQNGIVRIFNGTALLPAPFLDMSSVVLYSGERGLLSIAFHPQFATNRYFFVYYNNSAGSGELAQYQTLATNPDAADPASRKVLLTIPKPFDNHNGCKLNFGPDGNLYFAPGDGGSGGDPNNYAQNLNSYLGKMLRINVDNFTTAPYYTIPAGNPYIGVPNTKPEIWYSGLRNPWRWNFDRLTGDMWIADVGQDAWEEINRIPAPVAGGLNFGWRCYEGNHPYNVSQCGATPLSGKSFPIFEYFHNNAGGFSVSGGLVYRGTEFPALQGYYFCADFVKPNGWLIKPDGVGGYTVLTQNNFPANVTTFGDAEDGTLYLATFPGTVYKIFHSNLVATQLLSFDATARTGRDMLTWNVTPDASLAGFEIERSPQGTQFTTIGFVASQGNTGNYSFAAKSIGADRYYRLKLLYNTGGATYSPVKKLPASSQGDISAVFISPKQIQLTTAMKLESVQLFSSTGQKIKNYNNLTAGTYLLQTNNAAAGLYFLKCLRADGSPETLPVIIY